MYLENRDIMITVLSGGTGTPKLLQGIKEIVDTKDLAIIVNTLENNVRSVVVTGGTFNADINHQYRPYEISIAKELALKDNGNGTWTIAPAEAYVTEIVDNYSHNVGYNYPFHTVIFHFSLLVKLFF